MRPTLPFPGPIAFAALLAAAPALAGALAPDVFADGFEGDCGGLVYAEDFDSGDGPWPAPWVELADSAASATILDGEARLRPVTSGYSLARMAADVPTRDVEVRFTLLLEDASAQGVGFYVRQNGGHLQLTTPTGVGYAVFVEGTFRGQPGVGLWREDNGHEINIAHSGGAAPAPQTGQRYRVRFRASQVDATTTLLQAKLWAEGDAEPLPWQVEVFDSQLDLQGASGGIAIDSWNVAQSGELSVDTRVDDIEVEALCNPIAARGAVEAVDEGFQFTEGPLWRGDHLLFSDIAGDSIHRLDPPAGISLFRAPSSRANGLALDGDGRLLAAEHEARRVSRTGDGGLVETLVEDYQGLQFNSPNDLVVASDGALYFTDPDYGLANPAGRELGFNGLFRLQDGVLHAEWEGVVGANQPNGVALSPDESVLYATDTHAGTLLAFDRAPDGSLSGMRTLADGLTIPDGLCVDARGNILVATWASPIEVFAPDGARWGAIPIPRQANNCVLGGSDARSLYVTAHEGLYRVAMPIGGAQ